MRVLKLVVPRLNVSHANFKMFEETNRICAKDAFAWQDMSNGRRATYLFVQRAVQNRRSTLDGIWLEDSSHVIETLGKYGTPKEEAARAAQGVNELLNEYEGGVVEIIFHPTPHREEASMELRH